MGKTQNKSKSDFVLIVKLKVSKTWLQVLCASKLSRYQREKITTIFVCQGDTKYQFYKIWGLQNLFKFRDLGMFSLNKLNLICTASSNIVSHTTPLLQ